MINYSANRLRIVSCLHAIQLTRLCFAVPGTTKFTLPTGGNGPPGSNHQPTATGSAGPPGSVVSTGSNQPPATGRPTTSGISPASPQVDLNTFGPPAFMPPVSDRTSSFNASTRTTYNSTVTTPSSQFTDNTGSSSFKTDATVSWAPYSWTDEPSLYAADFSPIDFITGICPNTTFCQKANGPDSFEPPDSCCLQCDCSDDCVVKGNCCHDKDIPNHLIRQETPISSRNESCIFPTYGNYSVQELLSRNKKSFLIIASCPGIKDIGHPSPLHDYCEKPEVSELRSIMEIVPVYSSTKAVSYSNTFCAMCNADITFLMPWTHTTLLCEDLMSFSMVLTAASSLQSFIKSLSVLPCVLEFHPPNNGSVGCLHQDALISECKLPTINPILRDYCKNVTIPFGQGEKIYKNIFCFGCNEFSPVIHSSACGDSFFGGYGYDFGKPEAIVDVEALEVGLFFTSTEDDSKTNGTDEQCEDGLVYNQPLDQCVAYVCAPSKVNVSGKCLSVLIGLKNVGLDYKVAYRFLIGTASTEKHTYVMETINAALDVEASENEVTDTSAICRRSAKTIASLRDYHVTYITLVTRAVSEMTNIEEEYFKFKERLVPLMNREKGFETNLDHDGFQYLPFGVIDFVRFSDVESSHHYCPESRLAMTDLQFCDAVRFRIVPEQMDKDRNLLVKSVEFKPSEYLVLTQTDNHTTLMHAQICRDLFSEKILTLQDKDIASDGDVSASRSYKWNVLFIALLAVLGVRASNNY